jgi:hypothetical protein
MLTMPICDVVAVPVACNCVGETYVVVSVCPLNVTVEFVKKPLPVRVSENAPAVIGEGETDVRTGIGFCSETALVAFFVVSAALVAVMVRVFGVGRLAGAVYIPFVSIVPVVALPPATEFTDQVTLVFVLPLTAAAKLAFAPARTVAVAGVTVTLTLVVLSGGKVGEAPPPLVFVPTPAQPVSNKTRIPACALQILLTDMVPLGRRQPTLLRRQQGLQCCSRFRLNFYKEWAVPAWVERE